MSPRKSGDSVSNDVKKSRKGRMANRFGAHMSIAGGFEKAIERALLAGCDCVQIFVKNNNQWNCKPLENDQIAEWQTHFDDSVLIDAIAHTSYLINLASPDPSLWRKSVDALIVEWQRAEALKLSGLVLHPGAFTTGTEVAGLSRVSDAVVEAIEAVRPTITKLLLENTAGQGTCLGHRVGQLGQLLSLINMHEHVGVCFDTCHAFAAGYELNTVRGFKEMKKEIKDLLPTGAIRALHLNDSKKACGSRVDRHEHIGIGAIGDEGFRLVLEDSLFSKIPGYLETPKETDQSTGEDWDVLNLRRLRLLAGVAEKSK